MISFPFLNLAQQDDVIRKMDSIGFGAGSAYFYTCVAAYLSSSWCGSYVFLFFLSFFTRLSKSVVRFREVLDVIKFICKEMWTSMYGKQIDNLRTNKTVRHARILFLNIFAFSAVPCSIIAWNLNLNALTSLFSSAHQTMFVLQDNNFDSLARIPPGAATPEQQQQVWFSHKHVDPFIFNINLAQRNR